MQTKAAKSQTQKINSTTQTQYGVRTCHRIWIFKFKIRTENEKRQLLWVLKNRVLIFSVSAYYSIYSLSLCVDWLVGSSRACDVRLLSFCCVKHFSSRIFLLYKPKLTIYIYTRRFHIFYDYYPNCYMMMVCGIGIIGSKNANI